MKNGTKFPMMNKKDEWYENTSISWWRESRKKLNKVIRKYNTWIDEGADSLTKTAKLLEKIKKNLKMDYCNQEGGNNYWEELNDMKIVVKERLKFLANNDD